AYLLGVNALRASEAAAVRIEDSTDVLRGHRVLHLLAQDEKGDVSVPRAFQGSTAPFRTRGNSSSRFACLPSMRVLPVKSTNCPWRSPTQPSHSDRPVVALM